MSTGDETCGPVRVRGARALVDAEGDRDLPRSMQQPVGSGEAHDHPDQQPGEVTLADARWLEPRTIRNVITRNSPIVRGGRDVRKVPRQGHFDSVHLAPHMRLSFEDELGERVELRDVVMMNQCLHDCTHMHVRWSEFLDDPEVHLMTFGWKNGSVETLVRMPWFNSR